MVVYNLEQLTPDGFKKEATSITHVRLYYDDFTGNNYVQGAFLSGSTSIVQFDIGAVSFVLFKMFTSTDGTNYTERPSFGGDDGTSVIDSNMILNANDYVDDSMLIKKTVSGIAQWSAIPKSELIGSSGVDYKYVRGTLTQYNGVFSNKCFFGNLLVNESTGAFDSYTLNPPIQTVADAFGSTNSAKVSTGIYKLQFRTNAANGFVAGFSTSYRFQDQVFPVYKSLDSVYDEFSELYINVRETEFVGTCVIDTTSDTAALAYNDGFILIYTYNAAGSLADDILKAGLWVELKALPIS